VHDTPERLTATLADRYRVVRLLGEGGMASVFLARDLKHERDVAIKVLKPVLAEIIGKERFLAEIKTTATLRHPHILPLFDSGEADGLLYYVMPLAEGETLRSRLDREGKLPIAEALRIAGEIASALSYAHARGVIHRDIKPDNVLLEGAHAVVADFGIARAVTSAGTERLTQTGMSMGTPAYMSPEQIAGDLELDARADQYSLACVVYEMLTGQPPFTGPGAAAIVRQHLTADPAPVSKLRADVPANAVAALSRALAKAATDRFATMAEFAEALAATSAPMRAARGRWPMVAAGLLVAAMAAVALLAPRTKTPQVPSSIAVLPFSDRSADRSQAYLGDGIAETLISALAKAGDIKVTPRSTAFAQRDNGGDLQAIGSALGVGTVLEGSVQRNGDALRITADLVSVADGTVLWSETFDRKADDIFAVQDEVVEAVLAVLQGRIRAASATFASSAGTRDRAAYEFYLQGLYFWNRRSLDDFEQAKEMFRRAIARDTAYAAPWAGLANASITQAFVDTISHPALLRRAREAAERAVQLDSAQGDARAALAYLRFILDGDFAGSDSAFRLVRADFPNVVMGAKWYADLLVAAGLVDSSMAELRRAYAMDPALAITLYNIGNLFHIQGQLDSAESWYVRSLEAAPRLVLSLVARARMATERGDSATALAMLARLKDASTRMPIPVDELERAWGRGGPKAMARLLGDARRVPRAAGERTYWLAIAGDYDDVLRAWDDAIASGDVWALFIASRREFAALRGDPRFKERMERLQMPATAFAAFTTTSR
jgi:serine/threonine-protein kinase